MADNEFNKITVGFVVQKYKTMGNGSHVCIGQEFVAGDQVDYENLNGEPVTVDTLKENYQPFDMAFKQVATGGLKFVCPECQGTRLECCEDGAYNSEVLNIDEDGDFDYGDINASGGVERFQCLKCGHVLLAKEKGFAEYPVTDNEEVVEWIKKNCKQEE